jgi:hypothetical protein
MRRLKRFSTTAMLLLAVMFAALTAREFRAQAQCATYPPCFCENYGAPMTCHYLCTCQPYSPCCWDAYGTCNPGWDSCHFKVCQIGSCVG